ncbi:MAG: dihydrolipoamide acetyltransferase family protein [Anaerolineae bacterium]|jgi:pyruvate dehydrogenase E2 component (dihydrolipoamide acetyltransferase)
MATEVILPKLGQTMEEGTIVEWLKNEGEEVQRGDVLFTVESDKATLEAEAPARGYLRKILVPAGESVPVLTTVGIITRTLDEDISASSQGPAETAVASESAEPAETAEVAPTEQPKDAAPAWEGRIFASPRARMRAQENEVELRLVEGTGPNGRIVERDIYAFLEEQPKATPMARKVAAELGVDLRTVSGTGAGGRIVRADVEMAVAPAPAAGPVATPARAPAPVVALPPAEVASTEPLKGLRGIIAERMATSAQTTARVTLFTEVDATAFVEARTRLKAAVTEEWGFAPGYNDLLGLMVARALHEYAYMNARLSGDEIQRLDHVNVGMAVDTERGLLVPVIRDADRLGLRAFGQQFRDMVGRARVGRSLPDDLSGGTFTITNLGMFDVDLFTPIINLPEAAILGVGRIQAKPVVREDQVVVAQMMTLSLAFDHRLVDGAPAARFLQRIKQLVENPYLLLG